MLCKCSRRRGHSTYNMKSHVLTLYNIAKNSSTEKKKTDIILIEDYFADYSSSSTRVFYVFRYDRFW